MNKEIDKDLLVDLIRLYFMEVRDLNISVDDYLDIVDRIYVYLEILGGKEWI